ncbi:MAG: M23 family metallopeptidase, partial [Gemmatimonadota bacterium]|nr:M23 family metallopeptidase [Gemmatimonadota bacterium]
MRSRDRRVAGLPRAPVRLAMLAALLPMFSSCQVPRWPIQGTLRSPFGIRMEGLRPDVHRGVDVASPTGTPVRPILDGRIRFAGVMRGYGSVIWVDHGETLLSLYAHLSEIRVEEGASVGQRDVIGLVGMTGNAQAPHLH